MEKTETNTPSKSMKQMTDEMNTTTEERELINKLEETVNPNYLEDLRRCFLDFQVKFQYIHESYIETHCETNCIDYFTPEMEILWKKMLGGTFTLFMKYPHPLLQDYEEMKGTK